MITLHSDILRESKKLHGAGAWLWLYKFTIDETTIATTVFRCVAQREPITFDDGSGAGAKTYYPYPITHSGFAENTEGNIPSVTATVADVQRIIGRLVFEGRGFSGMPVDIYIVHQEHLATPAAHTKLTFEVGDISIARGKVSMQLEPRNPRGLRLPHQRYSRRKCGHPAFGDPDSCGFPLYSGGPTTCDRLLATCDGYGDLAVAQGYPKLWPRQFGGEPGIEEGA